MLPATPSQVKSIADILKKTKGVDGALSYCKARIDKYEELISKAPRTFNELNERDSHKIMIEFYLAVSLMIQTIKSTDHDT